VVVVSNASPDTSCQPEVVIAPAPVVFFTTNRYDPWFEPGEMVPAPLFVIFWIGRSPGSGVMVVPDRFPRSRVVTRAPPVIT
jgi:hypothetical protein